MKVLIAIPCMDMVATQFFRSCLTLQYRDGESYQYMTIQSSLTYDARNMLAKYACENGFDRILWLDSDMVFEPDLLKRLSARLDEGLDFVSAMYFRRVAPVKPVIYQAVYVSEKDGKKVPTAEAYEKYPRNSLFEIAGCGFGACMTTVSMVKDIAMTHGLPFSPRLGFGEDLSFCQLARETGYEIYCDSRIIAGHIGQHIFGEEDFDA